LAHATEIGVIELRLVAIALRERVEQGERRIKADAMTLGDIGHNAMPFGREVLHGLIGS
jgi:hypothetical protein